MPSYADLINLACPGLSANPNDVVVHARKLKECLLALDGTIPEGQGSVGAAVAGQVAVYNGVNSVTGYSDLSYDAVDGLTVLNSIRLGPSGGVSCAVISADPTGTIAFDAAGTAYGFNFNAPDGLAGNATLAWSPLDIPVATAGQLMPLVTNISTLGTAAFAWKSLFLGATPFEFKESAPGVLQLGSQDLTFTGAVLTVGGFVETTSTATLSAIGQSLTFTDPLVDTWEFKATGSGIFQLGTVNFILDVDSGNIFNCGGVYAPTAPSTIIPPTSDPAIAGALWNNAGTLAISAG